MALEALVPVDVGVARAKYARQIALKPCIPSLLDHVHGLLRHALLPQPHRFEGVFPRSEIRHTHNRSIPQGRDVCYSLLEGCPAAFASRKYAEAGNDLITMID